MQRVGTKEQVWMGQAITTAGCLRKSDLMKSKRGKVVSKLQHAHGKRMFLRNKLKRFRKRPRPRKQTSIKKFFVVR